MLQWIDNLPWSLVLIAAILLGLAPFFPQPHLVEKLRMLADHTLKRPIDESVDLIGFSFEIKAYEKIYHRHIVDIPRINFFV